MISLIAHHDPKIRDAFVRALSLEKKEETPQGTTYQHGKWIYILLEQPLTSEVARSLIETYQPENMYLPVFGASIDMIHEEGDVLLPNVFLSYDAQILTLEEDGSNRDVLMGEARFLEIYEEQRDYYVEDFGLSIGGILVSDVPADIEDQSILMKVYEADIYIQEIMSPIIDLIEENHVPTILTAGVIQGKKSQKKSENTLDTTIANMITTWRLMEDDAQ